MSLISRRQLRTQSVAVIDKCIRVQESTTVEHWQCPELAPALRATPSPVSHVSLPVRYGDRRAEQLDDGMNVGRRKAATESMV